MERQTEVAAYAKCSLEQLIAWLNAFIGPLEESERIGESIFYLSRFGPVIVITNVEDVSYIEVCCNAPTGLWATNVDFARLVARELNCIVRCDPGQHYPDVDPLSDTLLEINGDREQLVTWVDVDSED